MLDLRITLEKSQERTIGPAGEVLSQTYAGSYHSIAGEPRVMTISVYRDGLEALGHPERFHLRAERNG